MSRRSFMVRMARRVQRIPISFLRVFEAPFVSMPRRGQGDPAMIILIALPRGGSTLTYQALVHALDGTYLSNLWNLFYATPLFGGLLSKAKCARYRSSFRSEQGFVDGLCGPAEGLKFWSYWCDYGLDECVAAAMPKKQLSEARPQYLKRVLSILSREDRPFISGYIGHALVLSRLGSLFPSAVFVRLTRDPVDNALSILKIRKESPEKSFSVLPRECLPILKDSLHKQVAAQVHYLNQRIDNEIDPDRTIYVSYEKLCSNPTVEVSRIAEFCNLKGMSVRMKQSLPDSFPHGSKDDARISRDAQLLRSELLTLSDRQAPCGRNDVDAGFGHE